MQAQIYDLVGQQDDPLVEEALMILFSDRPVRESIRADTRSHWQWQVRSPKGSTSLVWLSFAQPITDATPREVKRRIEDALAVLVPDFAKAVSATVKRVSINSITMDITITKPGGSTASFGVSLEA